MLQFDFNFLKLLIGRHLRLSSLINVIDIFSCHNSFELIDWISLSMYQIIYHRFKIASSEEKLSQYRTRKQHKFHHESNHFNLCRWYRRQLTGNAIGKLFLSENLILFFINRSINVINSFSLYQIDTLYDIAFKLLHDKWKDPKSWVELTMKQLFFCWDHKFTWHELWWASESCIMKNLFELWWTPFDEWKLKP